MSKKLKEIKLSDDYITYSDLSNLSASISSYEESRISSNIQEYLLSDILEIENQKIGDLRFFKIHATFEQNSKSFDFYALSSTNFH